MATTNTSKILMVLILAAMPELFLASAQTIQDALQALTNGDYQTALVIIRPLAQEGNAQAQSTLGAMYGNGWGVARNHVEAVNWYRKAADQGFAPAQFNLGMAYHEGQAVPKSDVEAVNWYRKAGDQNYAPAQYDLGVLYDEGRAVPRNDVEAVNWYRKAADQGLASAQYNLGAMHHEGRGASQNDVEAVSWWRKAADQGHVKAEYNLGVAYTAGQGVPQSDVEAVNWYRKAADQGFGPAQTNLGVMYRDGRGGLQKDDIQAVNWFRRGADVGDGLGMYNLGAMYEDGRGGLPKDDSQAVSWYRKAAQLGNTDAQKALTRPQNAEEAYRRAAHLVQTAHVDEAILMFGKAIVLKPGWAQAFAARGRALSQAKRYAEAIKDFDEAIRLDDKHSAWYDARGLAYSNSGQHKRAIEDYNRAIELTPYASAYYNNRGWAYSESGQPERGGDDLTKAIQLAPDFVRAYENRANAYTQMKDWSHAIADYTAAIEIRPTAWQYQRRAEAKLASGDQKGAEEDRLKVIQTVSERTQEPLGSKPQGQTRAPQYPESGDGSHTSAYRVGAGVSAPVPLFKPDPEYSDVARKAGLRGKVTLQLIVDSLGSTRDIRVVRSLGLGLDEKAIDAVRNWQFRPGYRNGEAVAVQATVEVNFRFLEPPHGWQVTRVGFNVPPGTNIPELIDLRMPKSHSYKNATDARPVLTFEIDQSGTPQHLDVNNAADPAMIEDLIKAAQAWHFAPAQKDGRFVSASASFEFYWVRADKK